MMRLMIVLKTSSRNMHQTPMKSSKFISFFKQFDKFWPQLCVITIFFFCFVFLSNSNGTYIMFLI